MLEPADISARPLVLAPLLALFLCSGCIGHRMIYPVMPTAQELHEFQAAGPADVQVEALETGSMRVAGPYRVVAGDLLLARLKNPARPYLNVGVQMTFEPPVDSSDGDVAADPDRIAGDKRES